MRLWKAASKRKYLRLASCLITISLPVERTAWGGYLNGSPFDPSDCAVILREQADLASRNILENRAYKAWDRPRVRVLARKIATTYLSELRRSTLQNQLTFLRENLSNCEDIYHAVFEKEMRRVRRRAAWRDLENRRRLMAEAADNTQEKAAEEIGYFVREQIDEESGTDGISDLLEYFPKSKIRMDTFESTVALTRQLLEMASYMLYFSEADEWKTAIPFDRSPVEPKAQAEVAAMWAAESLPVPGEEKRSISNFEFDRLSGLLDAIKKRHGSEPYTLPRHLAPSKRQPDSVLRQIIASAPLPEFFRQFLKAYVKFIARNRIPIYSGMNDLCYLAVQHVQLVSPESGFLLSDE